MERERCPTWGTKTNTMGFKHLLNGMILQSGWMQKCNSIGCLNWIASLGDVEVTNTSESMMASLEKNIPSSNLGSRPKKKHGPRNVDKKSFRGHQIWVQKIYAVQTIFRGYISFEEGRLKFLHSIPHMPLPPVGFLDENKQSKGIVIEKSTKKKAFCLIFSTLGFFGGEKRNCP